MMALDMRFGLADDLLLYTDKITMRSSLECRVPILDHELVAYMESLSYEYRVRYGLTKIIHKEFARTALPPAIIERPKRGFWSPTAAWFRNTDHLSSMLLDPNSKFAAHFDLTSVARTIAEHKQGHNRERHLFLLLCLYYWLAEFA
jgi:asparagine synthase (glutamine-hydrolysing)